jgi:hypothetical protein
MISKVNRFFETGDMEQEKLWLCVEVAKRIHGMERLSVNISNMLIRGCW